MNAVRVKLRRASATGPTSSKFGLGGGEEMPVVKAAPTRRCRHLLPFVAGRQCAAEATTPRRLVCLSQVHEEQGGPPTHRPKDHPTTGPATTAQEPVRPKRETQTHRTTPSRRRLVAQRPRHVLAARARHKVSTCFCSAAERRPATACPKLSRPSGARASTRSRLLGWSSRPCSGSCNAGRRGRCERCGWWCAHVMSGRVELLTWAMRSCL